MSDDSWSESTVTYANQPAFGDAIVTLDYVGKELWYEIELTDYAIKELAKDGIMSFAMKHEDREVLNFRSKEQSGYQPQLIITWDEAQAQNISENELDTHIVIPTDDAFVKTADITDPANDYDANKNFGSWKYVPATGNPINTRNSFFKFDVTQLSDVNSAILNLYCHERSGHPTDGIKIYAVNDDSWEEMVITYNTQPAHGKLISDALIIDGDERWYQVDLTSYVREESLGDGIVSFVLTAETNEVLNFRSSEQSGLEPYLEIKTINENYTAPVIEDYTPQLNGNISSMLWKGFDDAYTNVMTYDYDKLNRLIKAEYGKGSFTGNVFSRMNLVQDGFSVPAISYDLNGNILSLERNTQTQVGATAMDILSYTYEANGESNRLAAVMDEVNSHQGFVDGNKQGDDYAYDANGNLIKDLNKDITSIEYNHLNLPTKVTKSDGKYIEYIYDAAGMKLRQVVHDMQVKTTDYIGENIYENDTLIFVQHEEGRIVPNQVSGAMDYQYHLKDHLGNVRTTFTTAPNTIEFTLNYEGNLPDEALFEEITPIISNDIFDHTDAGNSYTKSQLLTGDTGSKVGAILTIPVAKGDIISAEAFVKYEDPSTTANDLTTTVAMTLLGTLTGQTGMINEFGAQSINNAYPVSNNGAIIGTPLFPYTGSVKGFLNLLFIDEEGTGEIDQSRFAYDQISSGGNQNIGGPIVPHEELNIDGFVAPANGIIIVYVSNEQDNRTNMYFDDVKVTIEEHPVIQSDDYYPFGLTFNSFQRVTSEKNRLNTFQDQELVDDLDLNWVQFKWRNHDPTIGRFFNVDPLAEKYVYNSPYAFSENRVIDGVELEGLEYVSFHILVNNGMVQSISTEKDYDLQNPNTKGPGIQYTYTHITESGDGINIVTIENFEENFHGIYQGPNNPKLPKVGGAYDELHDDYSLEPIDEADANAKQHDQDFDEFGGSGALGILDARSTKANEDYNERAAIIQEKYKNGENDSVTGEPVTKEANNAASFGSFWFRLIENLLKNSDNEKPKG